MGAGGNDLRDPHDGQSTLQAGCTGSGATVPAGDRRGRGGAVRVLQLHTPYRQPGGEDAVVRAEAEVLRRSGHEDVQHQVQNPPGAAGAIGSLVLSPWNPLQARKVQGLAERIRPDVAHVHNTWYAQSPAVLWALRRSGVPTVMTLHNYRLVCANGQLFRDGAPCEDCVGTSPWHGVQH